MASDRDTCKYIWKESNGDMEEALRFMSDNILCPPPPHPSPFCMSGMGATAH